MQRVLLFLLLMGMVSLLASCFGGEPDSYLVKGSSVLVSDPLPQKGFLSKARSLPAVIDTSYFERGGTTRLAGKTHIGWTTRPRAKALFIDFNEVFNAEDEPPEDKVVYVAEVLQTRRAKDTLLSLGSDDGFTLWINGDSVTSTNKSRGLKAHDDLIPISLRPGKNILLYRIEQGSGNWGLYRELRRFAAADTLIQAGHHNLYADRPESAILSDTATSVPLKPNRVRLDSFPLVRFSWKPWIGHETFSEGSSYRGTYPRHLPLPDSFSGKAVLHVSVEYPHTHQVLYEEEIPILHRSEARQLAQTLTTPDTASSSPVLVARQRAVREMFHLDGESSTPYSTRMKAHALVDLYRYVHAPLHFYQYPGPQIWGYRSKLDSTVQPFRLVVPLALSRASWRTPKAGLPLAIKFDFNQDEMFWRGRAHSHYEMSRQVARAQTGPVLLAIPHGRGQKDYVGTPTEEIPLMISQIERYFNLDRRRIGLSAWSHQAVSAIKLMEERKMPITHLGFTGPALSMDNISLQTRLTTLHDEYPHLQLFMRHGLRDPKIPGRVMQKWVQAFQSAGFTVDYEEWPYSYHSVFLFSTNKEFYEWIAGKHGTALQSEISRLISMRKKTTRSSQIKPK